VPFIDREQELAWLASGLDGRPQLRILYGRRRTGKSRLLDEFVRNQGHVTYQAVEGSTPDHLADLTAAVRRYRDDPVLAAAPFGNWDAALSYLVQLAADGPLVVIFDEYQYAAQADPTLASRIQRWWSREVGDAQLYLVLCGSYVRFFVENVLTGPAYGRNTGSLQLHPLGYREAGQFFPKWSPEDRIRGFAVTGGMPYYLDQLAPDRSLRWNIVNRVLARGSVLYQEAELLMREELREPRVYMSILRAVSDGITQTSKIQDRVSMRGSITSYLGTLQELGLLHFQQPVVGKTVRRGMWMVADPYLRFWFRFVHPYRGELEHGADVDRFYQAAVEPVLDEFVSRPTFEEVCRDYVRLLITRGEIAGVDRVGPWWGPVPAPRPENPRFQTEGELEVVAAVGNTVVLVGEAKWTNAAVSLRELQRLRHLVQHVPGAGPETRLLLFGRRFQPSLVEAARDPRLRLVPPSMLYE
jgi:AAA+ ATPase superfamily predicted ATPase